MSVGGGAFSSVLLLIVAFGLSCGSQKVAPERVVLEGTAVARVGDDVIASETVASIARAQSVDVRRALDLATFDALAAAEAKSRGLQAREKKALDASLARVLIDSLTEEARSKGPPTDREIEALTRDEWIDVARPESVVVVHAVVQIPEDADPATTARALAVATRIHEAVEPAVTLARESSPPDYMPKRSVPRPNDEPADSFANLVKGVPTDGFKVTAEPLPPLGSDNLSLVIERRSTFASEFVSEAFKLRRRGNLSGPIRSSFGFHVILLLDRLPPSMLSLEQRRKFFEHRVLEKRTEKRIAQLLNELRANTEVADQPTNVDALLAIVKVAP